MIPIPPTPGNRPEQKNPNKSNDEQNRKEAQGRSGTGKGDIEEKINPPGTRKQANRKHNQGTAGIKNMIRSKQEEQREKTTAKHGGDAGAEEGADVESLFLFLGFCAHH